MKRDAPPTASRLLWLAAGRPCLPPREVPPRKGAPPGTPPTLEPLERPADGPCWWCAADIGDAAGGLGIAIDDAIPDTFPDRAMARARRSPWVCAACAWTLCETISLPAAYAGARIVKKCAQGARMNVCIHGGAPVRRLLLLLDSGEVGLWDTAPSAILEEPWKEAIPELRAAPRDVGPCAFLGSVPPSALSAGPTEKFRSYHHFGWWDPERETGEWTACTDSDRAQMRDLLLRPPAFPWTAIIGDGKAHAAVYALDGVVSPGETPRLWYRHTRCHISYRPEDLAAYLDAWTRLRVMGASDEEVARGDYQRAMPGAARPLTLLLNRARRTPALIVLLAQLRQHPKELEEGEDE